MQEDENSTDDPDVETGGGETAEIGFTQSVIDDSEATQTSETQAEESSVATPQPVLLGAGASQPVMLGTVNTQPMMQAQPYGQVMMVGPPSGAPKVIGVLTIVWGALGLLEGFSIFTIPKTLAFVTLTLLKVITSLGLIYSGILIYSYQKRGIQLTWVLILVGTVISVALASMIPAIDVEEMVANGDITQEEADFFNEQEGLLMGVEIGISVFCGGICGLFVAVPLMVANNGLDNSSLFSSTKPDNIDGGTMKEYMGENEMAAAGETQEE